MGGITIVTGSPGAGKTTFSAHAAEAEPRGLHLPADVFYTFPAHPIAPTLPEAHAQNTAIIAAVSHAAATFAARGYEVFLDGIFGPWFLPVVAAELAPTGIRVEYVVLRTSLDEAVRRATTRADPGPEEVVRQMHAEFEDLGAYASNALDTTHLGVEMLVVEFARRRAAGDFVLDLGRARGPT